jgi:hypothetical protein
VNGTLWFLSYIVIGFLAFLVAVVTLIALESIWTYYRDRFK